MHLDIVEALKQGFNRTLEKNGLMLAGLIFITSVISSSLSSSLSQGIPSQYQSETASYVLALPISPMIAGILLIPTTILSAIIGIAAIRTFVSDETETIPEEFYKRNLLSALLNMIVGGMVFGLGVMAVLLLPALPGAVLSLIGLRLIGAVLAVIGTLIGIPLMFYLLLSLYFWVFYVVVEDQNFIEGFKNSWDLTEGHKLGLLVLLIAMFIVSLLVNLFGSIPKLFELEIAGTILGLILSAFTSAFSTATLAKAYNQLQSA